MKRARRVRHRQGIALVYLLIMLPVLCGCCALAVDFGYVELGQIQLQQVADASAHDYMVLYNANGNSQTTAQSLGSTTKNSVFTLNGTAPTVTATWGYWNASSQTFSTSSSSGATPAVKVIASCQTIPLLFASIIGQSSIGLSESAVATSIGVTANVTIAATSNIYISGMPASTVTYWGDTGTANAPTQATIPVIPGSYISFSTFTGTSSVIYPDMPYYGPNGSTGQYGTATEHGQNWDGTYLSASTDYGIADAIMPESSLMGLFLDNTQSDSTPAPATTVDWTQSSVKNQNSFTSLSLKSPFFIGDGLNGSTVKTFQVPAGATRLFLGTWDGVQWNNNSGSISGQVTVRNQVLIVQ